VTDPESEYERAQERTHERGYEPVYDQRPVYEHSAYEQQHFDSGYPSDSDSDDGVSQEAPEAVDPQQWIDRLTADLEDAQHRLGPEHRDTFKARVDLATAYRQIGEPGLAVPLAVRNTLQAGMLFPAGGPVPASLRKFQDEVCAEAGYTVGDVRLLESVDEEVQAVIVAVPDERESAAFESSTFESGAFEPDSFEPEPAADEPKPVEADAYAEFPETTAEMTVDMSIDTSTGMVTDMVVVDPPSAVPHAEAAVATAESELAYEVIRLRFELQEAERTIDRLRRRNGKLIDALREDD